MATLSLHANSSDIPGKKSYLLCLLSLFLTFVFISNAKKNENVYPATLL